MATKVSYRQGTKQTYLGLEEKLSSALYFCTDTKELFKGEDLYSDGLRLVDSFAALPAFTAVADGVIYYCKDSGCGYVLNEQRNAWLQVIYGVDNETIGISAEGLMQVKAVPLGVVTGLGEELKRIETIALDGGSIATVDKAGKIKPGSEFAVSADGTLSLTAIEIAKVTGLEDRLAAVEKAVVGGVRYCGAVETYADLPVDAKQGDLYEVREDNSEWCFNGEEWFEYGKTVDIDLSDYAEKDEVRAIAKMVDYEIYSKPYGTLVDYMENEIRVMCPADTKWEKQSVGSTGNPNMYYMSFRAYAPEGAVSFKEGDRGVIIDEMFDFNGSFAGTDEFGRNYSECWLALASYDEATDTWTYFGKNSSAEKYIGWDYVVEWYDANGVVIASDGIRINLSNEDCHDNVMPFYMAGIQAALKGLEEAYTWSDM